MEQTEQYEEAGAGRSRHSIPGPRALLHAIAEIIAVPSKRSLRDIDASAFYYPFVGIVIGLLWVGCDRAVRTAWGPYWASASVLALGLMLTGGRMIGGAGRTFAAIPRALRWRGVLGWLSMIAILGLEWLSLSAADLLRVPALLFAPLLGVWAVVVLAFASKEARADGRRLKFAPDLTFTEFGVASAVTFAFVFWLTPLFGILLVACVAVLVVGMRAFFHWRFDGIGAENLGASYEITILCTFALLAAF